MADGHAPGAEWRPDPEGVAALRWWDGEKFTEHVHGESAQPEPLEEQDQPMSASDPLAAVVVGMANRPTLEEIQRSCRPNELPKFIAGERMAGVLAAFEDRCLVIKKGVMTNLMAGSLGGGRATTFLYAHVTGVEYNSGLVSGVLEILTPSYQGSSNKDFWRGTTRGRNANSDDPFTLSNTLPWTKKFYEDVRPHIDWMNQRIAEVHASRGPSTTRSSQVADAPSFSPQAQQTSLGLATEIERVAELHAKGVLTDEEFAEAKRVLIQRLNS